METVGSTSCVNAQYAHTACLPPTWLWQECSEGHHFSPINIFGIVYGDLQVSWNSNAFFIVLTLLVTFFLIELVAHISSPGDLIENGGCISKRICPVHRPSLWELKYGVSTDWMCWQPVQFLWTRSSPSLPAWAQELFVFMSSRDADISFPNSLRLQFYTKIR